MPQKNPNMHHDQPKIIHHSEKNSSQDNKIINIPKKGAKFPFTDHIFSQNNIVNAIKLQNK